MLGKYFQTNFTITLSLLTYIIMYYNCIIYYILYNRVVGFMMVFLGLFGFFNNYNLLNIKFFKFI